MRVKKCSALLVLAALVIGGAGAALADGMQVDNDVVAPGNQNRVSKVADPGDQVTASAQLVVDYQGQKHLAAPQTLVFAVDSDPTKTTLPAGYQVDDITVVIPATWGPGSTATGTGNITFTAPAAADDYAYTVKWVLPAASCASGRDCLTGASAFNISLTVEAPPANTAPVLSLTDIGPIEGNTLGGANGITFANTASDAEDGSLTGAIACDYDGTEVFPVGTTTVSCSVTDSGGLTDSGTFTVTVVDTTPPALTLPSDISTGPTNAFGATPTWTATASDIVDGPVSVTCSPVSGSQFGFGTTTVSCGATDAAGNPAGGSFTVTVTGFVFDGFYSPINMALTNSIKGGSTVPVKWRLYGEGGMQITDIAAVTSIRVAEYACSTGDVVANSEVSTTATGGTVLRYDTVGLQFVYNWKTPATKGRCYTLTVRFTDGSAKSANFMTK